MAVTARLSKRLLERLGDEAGAEFVEWIEDVNRHLGLLRNDVGSLRADMAALRADLSAFESRVTVRLETMKFDMLKWIFLFWVGTMGLVLALVKL